MLHDTFDHFVVPVHQEHSVERFNPYPANVENMVSS